MKTTLLLIAVLAALGWSCASKDAEEVGGETHWLAACVEDVDCGDGELSCVCGSCTRACAGDAACGGDKPAACFDLDSPLLLRRCEDLTFDNAGVCLPRCAKDAECGEGRSCVQRTCVPAVPNDADAAAELDAGDPSPTAPLRPNVSTSAFDGVSTDISWSEPVEVPLVNPVITGADERILGTWEQVGCDPVTNGLPPWGCWRMVVREDAAGAVVGTAVIVRADHNTSVDSASFVNGPFAAASGPERGYPSEVKITDYWALGHKLAADVPYRLLDGRFEDGTFTFGWSGFDVWHGWCRLQTPYRWNVAGHVFWFCVPQDEDAQAGIDEGKIVLCTSADFAPSCDQESERLPCPCVGMGGINSPACSPAYCHCDEQGCDADVHRWQGPSPVRLTLDGERLSGTWVADDYIAHVIFERVSP